MVGDSAAKDVRLLHIETPRLTRSVYLCTNPSNPKTMAVMSVMRLLVETVQQLTAAGIWPTSMGNSGAKAAPARQARDLPARS